MDLASGGNYALTTSESVIDLKPYRGYKVLIWCDEATLLFSPTPTLSTVTALTTAASNPNVSPNAIVADAIGAGVKVERVVQVKNSRMLAKVATGTGTLRIKPIQRM